MDELHHTNKYLLKIFRGNGFGTLKNLKYHMINIICGTVLDIDFEVPLCYCHKSRNVTSQEQSVYVLSVVILLELRAVSVSQKVTVLTDTMFSGLNYPYRPPDKTNTCKIKICINGLGYWKSFKS
jgi:hypothetical protein